MKPAPVILVLLALSAAVVVNLAGHDKVAAADPRVEVVSVADSGLITLQGGATLTLADVTLPVITAQSESCGAHTALDALRKLIVGQRVVVTPVGKSHVSRVLLDAEDVSERMVRIGWASPRQVISNPGRSRALMDASEDARRAKSGWWSECAPSQTQ